MWGSRKTNWYGPANKKHRYEWSLRQTSFTTLAPERGRKIGMLRLERRPAADHLRGHHLRWRPDLVSHVGWFTRAAFDACSCGGRFPVYVEMQLSATAACVQHSSCEPAWTGWTTTSTSWLTSRPWRATERFKSSAAPSKGWLTLTSILGGSHGLVVTGEGWCTRVLKL